MTDTWEAEYRRRLRVFMMTYGKAVQFDDDGDRDSVSPYGWDDHPANAHAVSDAYYVAPCRWVVPEGLKLVERSYSMFEGTFTSNKYEVGVNVNGCRCACGKFTDVTLRWVGSLADILWKLLDQPKDRNGLTI